MRGYAGILLAFALVIGLNACEVQESGGQARPRGWQLTKTAAGLVWTNPRDAHQQYTVTAKRSSSALAELGANVTVATLLSHKGAKLFDALPYPGCPGEAGLQTFIVTTSAPNRYVMRVAYTNWNGTAVTATYTRPGRTPDDLDAVSALTAAVCTAVEGQATLPPVSR